jgi:hypothetical protein
VPITHINFLPSPSPLPSFSTIMNGDHAPAPAVIIHDAPTYDVPPVSMFHQRLPRPMCRAITSCRFPSTMARRILWVAQSLRALLLGAAHA